MRPIEHVVVVHCKAGRERVWRVLANTPLMNQFLGNQPLATAAVEGGAGAARYLTRTKLLGVPLEYTEEPFAWSEQRFFSWRRDMRGGPTKVVAGHYQLEDDPSGEGTITTVRLTSIVRGIFFAPLVWIVQWSMARGLARFLRAIDGSEAAHESLVVQLSTTDRARAEKAGQKLAEGHDPKLVGKLVDHVCDGGDLEVQVIRPFELASQWEAPRDNVLRMCLAGVGAGLLDLQWSVLCPSCRTSTERLPSLRDLKVSAHCQTCDIRFGVDLDRAVEATFCPNPSIRMVEARPFCIGGPMLTPHVVSQVVVHPGEDPHLDVPPEAGRYRVFARGGAIAIVDAIAGAPAEVTARVLGEGEESGRRPAIEPAQIDVAPGGRIALESDPPAEYHAKLERTAWNFDAATALHVTQLPEFRAQFGGEALRPGLVLKIANVAIFFSDLCGSTALYAKVGDAAAFGVVSDCLEFGRAIVEKHGGTVIKTMGDAVMASFRDDEAAIRACAASLLEWESFARTHPLAHELDLKVGIASGPCTIVTANGVLDYFGQTVNTAARVQHQAGPRQFVAPAPLVAKVPEGLREIERFQASLKGLAGPVELVRLGIAGV